MSKLKHLFKRPIYKDDYRYRRNTVLALIAFISFASYTLISQSFKTLDELEVNYGQLTYSEVVKERYKGNNYRYTFVFKLNNMTQYLGLFLGSGDLAIDEGKYWKDRLKVGEGLTVYYENNIITKSENITRLISQIERNDEIIYQSETKVRGIIGFVLLIIDLLFIAMLVWLKRRYDLSKRS